MRRNMLIETIAQFLRTVLPAAGAPTSSTSASAPQKLGLTRIETPKFETLTSTPAHLPVRTNESSHSFSGTPGSSSEFVYEASPPTSSHDDDDTITEDVESTTTVPHVSDRHLQDKQYGIRKEGGEYMIGDSAVVIDDKRNLYIKNKRFRGTEGLWELLTRTKPNFDIVTSNDYRKYKSILEMTNAHLEGYTSGGNIHISRGYKYKQVISKLFGPTTRRRGAESALRRHWMQY
jgi:hypothetical protein